MKQLLDPIAAELPAYLATPARVLLILLLAFLALRIVPRLLAKLREAVEKHQDSAEDGRRLQTLTRVVRYAFNVAVAVVTVLLILGEFGVSVAPMLGAAGIVGIALGFGAQSLVKDYFSGFFLLLENQIRVGDIVEASGKSGVVEELTLRYLRLRDYSGNVHYIPNGTISVVTNMSLGYANAVFDLGVAYAENLDRVIAVIETVGKEVQQDPRFASLILDDLEIAGVEQLAESSVVIRGRIRTVPLEQFNVRREFLRRIKLAFDREGIEIPFPHRKLVYEAQERKAN
ncbi:Small-conductance mechanosensitive channel [Burkholderiales bacterium]|nr:MAG: mechanosensitive ion channel family protein [Burkholderiales bacterium]CAG1009330.1 Small-conductance mechanosensitive channel [Burkholderiales bacterium]